MRYKKNFEVEDLEITFESPFCRLKSEFKDSRKTYIVNAFKKFIVVLLAAAPQLEKIQKELKINEENFQAHTCNLEHFFKREGINELKKQFICKKESGEAHDKKHV